MRPHHRRAPGGAPRAALLKAARAEGGLPPDATLEFIIAGQTLFASAGRWLHPLFELERFLTERGIEGGRGEIRDKVIGRGAAFLLVRLGVQRAQAGLLSRLGKDVLDRAGVACTWETLVDQIACRTESILRGVTDPEQAYRILAERARACRREGSSG